jgi:hypothetical protein
LNNDINVVIGCGDTDELTEDRFDRRTSEEGIDISFDGSEVRVQVRYEKFKYQHYKHTNEIIYPCDELETFITTTVGERPEEVEEEFLDINVGDDFHSGGDIWTVEEIHDDYIMAKPLVQRQGRKRVRLTRFSNLEELKEQINAQT